MNLAKITGTYIFSYYRVNEDCGAVQTYYLVLYCIVLYIRVQVFVYDVHLYSVV